MSLIILDSQELESGLYSPTHVAAPRRHGRRPGQAAAGAAEEGKVVPIGLLPARCGSLWAAVEAKGAREWAGPRARPLCALSTVPLAAFPFV